MTETPNSSSSPDAPLDDVMIAMDVVDTLRHDKRIVERELNDEARRKTLIDELREIYRGQGLNVTDEMLEAGVKALEDERFTYKPPASGIGTWLAKLYVTRNQWGVYVIAGVAALGVIVLGNYFLFERPKLLAAQELRFELSERLPSKLRKLEADIASEAKDPQVAKTAAALRVSGLNATSSGDVKTARASAAKLEATLSRLRQVFSVRIVNRQGELTGLWRVPERNPDTYNYYVVVEAVGENGKPIVQSVMNEETGKRDRVSKWAVRVPKSVLDAVRADKNDDGILQNGIAGVKAAGDMEPVWTIPVPSGAITRW